MKHLFKTLFQKVRQWLDPPQDGTVTYKHYVRTGDCNQCGKCCSDIYLIHGAEIIHSVEHFNRLSKKFKDYQNFVPLRETETGVQFRCSHLQEDNSCGIYDDRPVFCKKYPSEATLMHGGKLAPECSFSFEARYAFDDILKRTAKQSTLRPGQLLNDVRANLPSPPNKVSS